MTVEHEGLTVDWFGLASVRIESADGTVVFFDPGRYGLLDDYEGSDADLVCVSHTHHYDPDAIERISTDETTVVVHEAVHHSETDRDVTQVRDLPGEVHRVDDETDTVAAGVILRTLPAYNRPDGPHVDDSGEPYHPEGRGCGFLLNVDGVEVCWPGDTDVLDGHAELDVSLFLPPIGGTFTMDRHEAAELVGDLEPDLVVPVHYDTFEEIEADAGAFADDVERRGVSVTLEDP
ncbi:MBL fold metallo-hydrolase [Halorientalis salina]|uniref:MBL fold metallo-hydrolase n=1 Tax=Halorientalis salina TaxID=2932266 RepID=UPI0010ABB877|nr:MBL fold metallo-hydrolase [Halorientalis salina]